MRLGRIKPNVVLERSSPNQSVRDGGPSAISRIVIHDTESHNYPTSKKDLEGVANWFGTSASQVSAHVITDGDGNSARCVRGDRKAWHVSAYNSTSLGIEQCGYASDSRETWFSRWRQLRETARWIARWSLHYGIPIRHDVDRGVCFHSDLGAAGGGHNDPGPNYPLKRVLFLARLYKKAHRG